eukprot:13845127-Alexandrium_andersonii.AAC.1
MNWFVAALAWLLPRFQKEGVVALPRLASGYRHSPLPECLAGAVAMALAWKPTKDQLDPGLPL